MSEEKLEYIYEKYVEWKAKPVLSNEEDPSYPKNADEFIKQYKIDKFILDDFTKRPGHYEQVIKASFVWAKSKIPDIIHAVFTDAKKLKTPEAAERFLAVLSELNKAMKQDGDGPSGRNNQINNFNFFGEIDDEKYRRIIAREAKRVATLPGGEVEAD